MSMRRPISGYRVIETRRGDTMQRIAAREFGDASRWYELVDINGLIPPYLVDDESLVATGVLLTGSSIRIPSNSMAVVHDEVNDDLFGTDVLLLKDGMLAVADGQLQTVTGAPNLRQAMGIVLATDPGDLLYHPTYGCGARAFIGASNTASNALVAAGMVKSAVSADPRIDRVTEAQVTITGDMLGIELDAVAVNSAQITLEI